MRTFFGAKTNGHPRFVKRKQKQFRSSAKSIQNKKKFFVSVDRISFTSTFSKFLIEYVH